MIVRGAWARGIVEGAVIDRPALMAGDRVEVIVPFGSELRFWPIGIELALDLDVTIVPIDDRTEPTPGRPVLDATTTPARWRDPGD